MTFNREISGWIINILMLLVTIFLVIRRKNLGKNIQYFIIAMGLGTCIEFFNIFMRLRNPNYNSSFSYSIGVILFVFLFLLIYFYQILESKKLKKIQLYLIIVFLLNYAISVLLIKDFFGSFPFITNFVNTILLLFSIVLLLNQTFNSNRIMHLKSYFPFWASLGLIIIYTGVLPLTIISSVADKSMNISIFYLFLAVFNILGYSIILFGVFRATSKKLTENAF
ncbi:MAG: hypothetical protein KBA33_08410 [Cloacibacterium sp.]|nr:hypothetical protein [Cloacibacterium sp.]